MPISGEIFTSNFEISHASLISPLRQTKSTGRLRLAADNHAYIKGSGVYGYIAQSLVIITASQHQAWGKSCHLVAIDTWMLLITYA